MTRKLRIYLDTSVFSAFYDERNPERQSLTQQFWNSLNQYEVLCSQLVLDELGRVGDPIRRERLIRLAQGCQVLTVGEAEQELARAYVAAGVVPARYIADALHIAVAVLGGANILVSWNFQHLVRRSTRLLVNYINAQRGLPSLEILAPPEVG
ncbi:MAG: type II toxin-antitoxin system VapC family toxin [Candidatus Bipolaricaulota bacterium]|nr:type II toxin-antitoxin system VapC family toxin [Candidatus Bipolaricaulota bacterium]MDW8031852.1 type II toxin-antitoxin system VapC family toxin [Candidatus Bipolaricaulota bacterium]